MISQGGITMKFTLKIDRDRPEEVVVHAHAESALTQEIQRICEDSSVELIGYLGDEAYRLTPSEICCFTVEDNKICALVGKKKLLMKCRLYQLEETLSGSFLKINQSCLANVKMIERFDASIGGTLMVRFKNGYVDYVSRRNLKIVKERFGL